MGATIFAVNSFNSARKDRMEQAKKLEKSRHQEALKSIAKDVSPISAIFKDGAGFLNSIISEKSDSINDGGANNADGKKDESISISMLKNILQVSKGDDDGKEGSAGSPEGNANKENKNKSASIASIAKSFSSLVTGEISESEFTNMIKYAQNTTQKGDVDETRSAIELINLFLEKQEEVKQHVISKGFLDLKGFDPTAMFYFLENEDTVKNPSWKRRKHRYFKGVDVSVVNGLNDALHLAEISYWDSVDKIKADLVDRTNNEWELIYCQLDSLPEKPSHFVAIKKGQSRWSPQLEVLIAVRGTNSVPDVLTDALLDDVTYRGGRAHAGIMRSGQYLVGKHRDLMLGLLEKFKKKEVKLTLVGHSLGAGERS